MTNISGDDLSRMGVSDFQNQGFALQQAKELQQLIQSIRH
jgi:hypothetical protein